MERAIERLKQIKARNRLISGDICHTEFLEEKDSLAEKVLELTRVMMS